MALLSNNTKIVEDLSMYNPSIYRGTEVAAISSELADAVTLNTTVLAKGTVELSREDQQIAEAFTKTLTSICDISVPTHDTYYIFPIDETGQPSASLARSWLEQVDSMANLQSTIDQIALSLALDFPVTFQTLQDMERIFVYDQSVSQQSIFRYMSPNFYAEAPKSAMLDRPLVDDIHLNDEFVNAIRAKYTDKQIEQATEVCSP